MDGAGDYTWRMMTDDSVDLISRVSRGTSGPAGGRMLLLPDGWMAYLSACISRLWN